MRVSATSTKSVTVTVIVRKIVEDMFIMVLVYYWIGFDKGLCGMHALLRSSPPSALSRSHLPLALHSTTHSFILVHLTRLGTARLTGDLPLTL